MRNTNNFVIDALLKAINIFIIFIHSEKEKIILVSKTNKDAQQFHNQVHYGDVIRLQQATNNYLHSPTTKY
jgi:hypothetical protein